MQPAPSPRGGLPCPPLAAAAAAMSAADSRSDRRRRREEDDAMQTAEVAPSGSQPNSEAVGAAMDSSQTDSSATDQPPLPPADVQPLPEQFRKRPRRSPRFSSPLDTLAVVELQLCLRFLDTRSRLKAARCNQRLLHAASAPFAWSATDAVPVTVRSAADVQRIYSSLLRFAPIHLRCVGLKSLRCVASVPHLVGLELQMTRHISSADLPQLLQHPNLARLQTLRLDTDTCLRLTVHTMRLIARLPQLHTLDAVELSNRAVAALLRPLPDAPALTDLTLRRSDLTVSEAALLSAISQCAGLRRLSLRSLQFARGLFRSFTSPNLRRLQRLELISILVAEDGFDATVDQNGGLLTASGADEYGAAFSALEQLQSLTLERVYGMNLFLPHLHRAPALRVLSIRCESDVAYIGIGSAFSTLPSRWSALPRRDVLSALLASAPQLQVRLHLPADLQRCLTLHQSTAGDLIPRQQSWYELPAMVAEMERVTVVDWQPPSA